MKLYTTPIEPQPTVYHVSGKRIRNKIKKEGLMTNTSHRIGYENALFAHNSPYITLDWYPFIMDLFDYFRLKKDSKTFFEMSDNEIIQTVLSQYYDIWEINTASLEQKWFVDTVGEQDFKRPFYCKEALYVVTFEPIPPKHLTLCTAFEERTQKFEFDFGWVQCEMIKMRD
jgi:hypothetical protein